MNRKKIMVVDDSPVIVRSLSMKLTSEGYDVCAAEDGASAVRAARREKPDLILLDISIENGGSHGVAWDGFLIIEWLRRLNEAQAAPIIVITGGDPAKLKSRALATGACAFFQKPVNNTELLDAIRKTLSEHDGAKPTPASAVPKPA